MTSKDTIIPCRKDFQGKYHVDSDTMLTSPKLLIPYIKNFLPIFKALQENLKLVLVPMPRYQTASCCEDRVHALNRQEESSHKTILGGLEQLRRAMRDFLFTRKINKKIKKFIGPVSPLANGWIKDF